MEITGVLQSTTEVETVGEKGIAKMSIIIEETDKQYPNSLSLDVWGDKTMISNVFKLGDKLRVEFNSKTREYNGRVYNSLSARKMEKVEEAKQSSMTF